MPSPKLLALINMLTAATLLIVFGAMTMDRLGLYVTPAVIIEASKDTSPETGMQLLANGIAQWQHRTAVFQWMCYGALPIMILNAFCGALRHREP